MDAKKILFLMVGLLPLLGGCASALNTGDSDNFGCPGMPKGVICKTPRQVYSMTNTNFTNIGANGEDHVSGKGSGGNKQTTTLPSIINSADLTAAQLAPVPVMEQAKVLRIWIAPWVDENHDLHWPGLMFTRVKTNKWSFGDNTSFEGVDPPVPHLMLQEHEPQQPKPLDVTKKKSNVSVAPSSNVFTTTPSDNNYGVNDESFK